MDLSFILAVEQAGHEKSETPFFVAGLLLAIFAVAVGAFGIARPTWGTDGLTRILIAVCAILVVLTAAMAVYVA